MRCAKCLAWLAECDCDLKGQVAALTAERDELLIAEAKLDRHLISQLNRAQSWKARAVSAEAALVALKQRVLAWVRESGAGIAHEDELVALFEEKR